MIDAYDITGAVALVHDQIFSLTGHRTSARLVRRLCTSGRWEIAVALHRDQSRLFDEVVKSIAFQQLSNERAS